MSETSSTPDSPSAVLPKKVSCTVIKDPPNFRERVLDAYRQVFSEEKTAVDFEKAVYNHAVYQAKYNNTPCNWENPQFLSGYKAKAMYVLRNHAEMVAIQNSSNITAATIICMKPSDIKPEIWRELIKLKEAKNKLYGIKPKANTWSFTCKKCKSNECSYYEMQTRSADEPMTTFILCLTCGNQWRMS